MNEWTKRSIQIANTDSYLDRLLDVYSIRDSAPRQIDPARWAQVTDSFEGSDDACLITSLLDLDLFPIKDPYVGYLKKDREAIKHNPKTVQRIASRVRKLSLDELRKKCSEPKESNRQMGPLFNDWVRRGGLGIPVFDDLSKFSNANGNRCFVGSDALKKEFVENNLQCQLRKGPDLLAVCNHKYVLGEAKLITDFGGHQQAQFDDAMRLLSIGLDTVRVAVLDGVIYINEGKNKMQKAVRRSAGHVMSSLVLREYLDSV